MAKPHTIDEFIAFALKPQNSDKDFEFVNDKVIERRPGPTLYSWYGQNIMFAIRMFCREHGVVCHTSSAYGAYHILGNVVAPNFAYKRTPMSDEYPDPEPPLWVVEIVSPTDKAPDIRAKRQIYRNAGILLWEMYPEEQSIDVYPPGKSMRTLDINETLDGGDVLPGFTLPVRDIFGQST
jgi:Uma2 family endonuclease